MVALQTPERPTVSVIIRSRDEADRLRLTLTALSVQTLRPEIVVVDDGSTDHTATVVREAQAVMPVTPVAHAVAKGRAAASNAGAHRATGDVLLFFDGDILASPGVVAAHAATHRAASRLIGRGETWHLRCTRTLLDPETASAQPAHAASVAALSGPERDRLKVTRAQILHDFDAIARRGQPGIYPGHGPRRLHELEMEALRDYPDCGVLWAAASGHNLSIRRETFLGAGGYDERIDNNEHRELALRLVARGCSVVPVEDARTYHLTHRSGWRDPMQDSGWADVVLTKHPLASVRLLPVFWAGLSAAGGPIATLPDLARAAAASAGRIEA